MSREGDRKEMNWEGLDWKEMNCERLDWKEINCEELDRIRLIKTK